MAHSCLREPFARFIDALYALDRRGLRAPGQGLGKVDGRVDAVQQRTVPVLFQTAPHAFDGVVLAVIGRVVGQLYRQAEVVSEVGKSGHKLGTSALILRAIVGIDEQGFYLWKANGNCGPEIFDAVYDEIAGHTGGRQIEIEFTLVRQIDAKGCLLYTSDAADE